MPTYTQTFIQKVWPSSMVAIGGRNDPQYPSDPYTKIFRKILRGEELLSCLNASLDNAIYSQSQTGEDYMVKGVKVQREFSIVNEEAEV